ncbi:gamma carbonic anhydrase family protein [Microbacterium sp. ZXX196]|uniref:gamma carbonic anhydrase family protein n=1 Tax=Microbacterium sp. ZXX196 TaxID=2609291 RepID=UPI0012B8564C|nr:gamma carbonic anhydrase family protein [Microbacterium sp. ZXX196]MTE23744.1 gamma carbonic anhydrase family protein [Microbacterium sp. ZXX196]
MTISSSATIRALGGARPEIADTAFVAEGARLVGDVAIADRASVWMNAVLRGDASPIRVGARSNVQDNVTIHTDAAHPAVVGSGVSIGHGAVVHGCTIGDGTLVGMGAVVLSGAVVGEECLVAAGAVVLEGAEIPARSLVAGVPARVRRPLTAEEIAGLRANAERYLAHAERHADSL